MPAPAPSPHHALIATFYAAFARLDAEGMIACYHRDVGFSDPGFGELNAARVRGMWRMLCGRAKDLVVEVSGIVADGDHGGAHWEARYTFAAGREVHNVIEAKFRFADGKIIRHESSKRNSSRTTTTGSVSTPISRSSTST